MRNHSIAACLCVLSVSVVLFGQTAANAPANMVEIKASEFWMGRVQMFRPDEQGYFLRPRIDDLPAHLIFIDTFYMDKTEVTQDDYAKFVQTVNHRAPFHWKDGRIPDGRGQHPVYNVSWDDADAYCRWAGKRLPTEAEWEKAARGGLEKQRYPWGNELRPAPPDAAPPATNAAAAGGAPQAARPQGPKLAHYAVPNGPAKVGSYPPNGFGLYDVMGNVAEWVNDWYDRTYYAVSPESNPTGPDSGLYRVIRGSSWTDPIETGDEVEPRVYGVYFRNFLNPSHRDVVVGFRCAKNAG